MALSPAPGSRPVRRNKPKSSIAVISFENLSGDPALDPYRKMIPSLLTTSLEQTQGFYVTGMERMQDILKQIGRQSGDLIDTELGLEICRRDGVKALVIGEFAKAGESFITNAKVLDSKTKRVLATARAQGAGPDSLCTTQVFELSRQIAGSLGIAKEQIDASLRPIGDVTTRSAEAYRYFLQGSEDLSKSQHTAARKSLEKAVEIDPEFAFAHFQLSEAYTGESNGPASRQSLERAHFLSKNATERQRFMIEGYYAYTIEQNLRPGAGDLPGIRRQVSQG